MFEQLETRQLLSSSLNDGVLAVNGGAGADAINISLDNAGQIVVNENGVNKSFAASAVTRIRVSGGNGNDHIVMASNLTTRAALYGDAGNDWVQAGAGNDSVYGGDGNDTILGGAGNDILCGNVGDDYVYGNDGNDKCYGEGFQVYTVVMPVVLNPLIIRRPLYSLRVIKGLRNAATVQPPVTAAVVATPAPLAVASLPQVTLPVIELPTYNDVIAGGNGNDELHGNDGKDTLHGHGGNDRIWGDKGNDRMFGHEGNDIFFAGAGSDLAYGGAGDDTFISIDNATLNDSMFGESGADSFWVDKDIVSFVTFTDFTDATAAEGKRFHAVQSFANGADRTLDGDNIADPTDGANYKSFSDRPLFPSTGPGEADVIQGSLGDCWLVAGMAALARTSANSVRQLVTELGDGTYAVQLGGNFYRVDGQLPTASATSWDQTKAHVGRENCIWAPIVEKAYTHFRTGANTYGSIAAGLGRESLPGLGGWNSGDKYFNTYSSNQALLDDIASKLGSGLAMTLGFDSVASGSAAIGGHEYTVMSVNRNAAGTVVSVTIRNPWGWDGTYSDSNSGDALVTMTGAQLRACAGSIAWANVC